MKKQICLFFMCFLFSINGFAIHDVVIDGVGYTLDKETQTARVEDDNQFNAEKFSIPETITVNGVEYTVTIIQRSAFSYNSKLQEIIIPKTVKTIGEQAFCQCGNLTSVTLSEGLEIIGNNSFSGTAIVSINIPSTVTQLSTTSFPYDTYNYGEVCKFENYTVAEGNTAYASYDGILYDAAKQTIISVPPYIKGDISLPTSLVEFNYTISSPYLISLTIPRGVRNITNFPTGANFERYIVDKNNQYYRSYDDGILYGVDNGSLTQIMHVPTAVSGAINIAEGITEIDTYTFSGRTKITSVNLPQSVVSVSQNAFTGCASLTAINLDNVSYIGGDAFSECISLTTISINKGYVSMDAFRNCSGLIKVYYNAEELLANVFNGCTNLTDITLGDNVSTLHYGAFENTGWLNKQANGPIYFNDFFYGFKGQVPETLKLKEGTKNFAKDWYKNVPYLTTLELNSDMEVVNTNIGDLPIDNLVITGPIYFSTGTLVANKNMNIHVKTAAMPFLNAYNKSSDGGGMGTAYPTQTVFGADITDKNILGTLYIPKGLKQRYIDVIEKKTNKYGEFYTFAYFASDIQEQYDVTDYMEDTSDGLKYSFDYSINLATVIGVENETVEEANIGGIITHDCRKFEVRVINSNAFENNASLRKVSISNSVVKAGANAFRRCTGLKEVTYDCNININSYNQEVEEGEHFGVQSMFRHCVLDKMVLGKHATRQLEYLYDIGEGRYFPEGWLLVKHFEVDNDNTRYAAVDGALYSKDMATLIRAPYKESVMQTRSEKETPELHIAEGVSAIGEMALTSTNYDIYVPSTVATIHMGAFKDCSATLHVEWSSPLEFSSSYTLENMTIIVPDEYISNYKNSTTWKNAKEIIGNESYTGIDSKFIESQETTTKCYDFLGRRVKRSNQSVPYIMNKRKFIPSRK
ncbi:MAG: leucine-rich repeat protein [Prevotella sp.]|nr:leucine-rich repeat protein [Prevotella sp.]